MIRRILESILILWLIGCGSDTQDNGEGELIQLGAFSDLLTLVEDLDSAVFTELVNNYLDTLSQAPVIESGTDAYFIYSGTASTVAVAGDFNGWNPSGRNFSRLGTTNLWYRKETFESNARLDYKIVVGSNWILDPRNPNRIGGGFGSNSELVMPEYVQPWEVKKNTNVSNGSLEEKSLISSFTEKTYVVKVYLPPNYSTAIKYPVAYFQDGNDYLSLAQTTTVLDNLIDGGTIEPLIGVFVVPNDRNIEYAFEDRFKYTDFFVSELVPYIDANYSTDASRERRAVIGDSYGGNISAIMAFSNPEVFGNCGIHSGAFQPNNFHTNGIVMDGVKKDMKIATIWGSYEGPSLPPNMRKVKDYLLDNDYDIIWKELPEGHSWGLWRATQDDMFEFFFPAK